MVDNREQDEVVNTIDGVIAVDAGPGTGKTYTIT
ncbi:MAG: UvrD-helicase domain-containing protein, partial [Candidatus Methanofastidiosa archaeon]|nr:UvrD-helicase domain-containing protein [Candidatus Methanofastidiosa archaeon]